MAEENKLADVGRVLTAIKHNMKSLTREFHVIIYGTTGFTGKLACEHLIRQYGFPPPPPLSNAGKNEEEEETSTEKSSDKTPNLLKSAPVRYAFAGRSKKKLEELKEYLADYFNSKSARSIPIIVADTEDDVALRHMSVRTHVVLNLVGPFMRYGENVVRSCVETNTNYCDITGEVPYVYRIQKMYGKIAEEKNIKIVHFCGFDSVPSDIGTLLVQNEAMQKFKFACHNVRLRFTQLAGGMSGGTLASAVNMYLSLNKEERKRLHDPYYLCRREELSDGTIVDVQRTPQPKLKMIEYEDDVGYVTEFIMARVNSKVVRWTNHKLNYKYGTNFKYSEGYGRRTLNMLTAFCVNFLTKYGLRVLLFPPLFWILSKTFLPKPGEGPSRSTMENGSFYAKIIGDCNDAQGSKHTVAALVGSDKGDPGYRETGKMLVECGMCIALENEKCEKKCGVLSPASAIGMVLVDRLKNAGMTFQIISKNEQLNHHDDDDEHTMVEK